MTQEPNADLGSQPFAKQLADPSQIPLTHAETGFEKARGVNRVEIRPGFASARVGGLAGDVPSQRLAVLRAVYDAEISFDFLKFAADGMSFVVKEEVRGTLESVLASTGLEFEVRGGRAVLIVHAVNMRDEAGLVAKVVSQVIDSGATIEHLGEMHDRLLMLMGETGANDAKAMLIAAYPGAAA
ncbi:MAG: hypothetical protein JSS71_01055 [Armatimonadetes bacterium]|nr:hypothetical protein [Armatimonadota bacterium]MBX3109069.1 hypothetical protein [Fimbriimonadaceae bacterium]